MNSLARTRCAFDIRASPRACLMMHVKCSKFNLITRRDTTDLNLRETRCVLQMFPLVRCMQRTKWTGDYMRCVVGSIGAINYDVHDAMIFFTNVLSNMPKYSEYLDY